MVLSFIIPFSWIDALDILLVAMLLYQLYKLIRGTVAINISLGIVALYLLWLLVKALNMQLLETILGQFIGVGFIALIIVFQQEIRRFLLLLGTNDFFKKFSLNLFAATASSASDNKLDVLAFIKACKTMSESNTGAIVVLTKSSTLDFYVSTGDVINAQLNTRLIESIFFKNNPLHDGAVIVTNNYIKAARCVLPVTENDNFPEHLGMRHRAAVGITEDSDAIAVIVSEQTGAISVCKEGKLTVDISIQQLSKLLEKEFNT
ncbi:MAG: TIGR00159 family protein [Bacteroidia bacterium]|nr:TIGR00159 family protein [Bacteroidia bacterium]